MIKLIASDMDGTLLDDKKVLNPEMIELIKKFKKMGITFAAASGRQSQSMFKLFSEVLDDIYVISENGAFVYHNRQELFTDTMEKGLVKSILDEILKIEGAEPFLCGKYEAYSTSRSTKKMMESDYFQYKVHLVDDIYSVREDVVKVSIFDHIDVNGNSYRTLLPRLGGMTELTVSGYNCLDIVNKGVSKGEAIEIIQKRLGILPEETAVFGDNYNDTSMFEKAYYAYAMENAEEGVKAQARFIAGSNNENGVINEIKRLTGV